MCEYVSLLQFWLQIFSNCVLSDITYIIVLDIKFFADTNLVSGQWKFINSSYNWMWVSVNVTEIKYLINN
jgi:hypothetical protein